MRILEKPLVPASEMSASNDPSSAPSPEFSPLSFAEELSVPLPVYKAASTSNFDIDGLLSSPLRLHEDLTNGCGGQTWPAGMVLAKHMLRYHREDLRDARILELGAGGGLVGLAVAKGCQVQSEHPMIITDQDEMFHLMGHNIGLNNLEDRVKHLILNWGEPLPEAVVNLKPNVILAADCVYFEPAFPLLQQTLSDLFALNEDATVYFCFKKRRRADPKFLKKAQKMFLVEEAFDEDRPVFSRETLFLYTFKKKTQKQAAPPKKPEEGSTAAQ